MILKLTKLINQNFWIFLIGAFGIALIFPQQCKVFYPHIELILGIIMFCSFLRVDIKKFFNHLKKPILPIIYTVFSLLIIPFILWNTFSFLDEWLRMGILLLALVPQGVATPTLIALIGGELEFTVVTLIISYFVTPLTTIVVIKFLAGKNINIPYTSIFWDLVILIFVPFFLAQGLKWLLKEKVEKCNPYFTLTSVSMMIALILGAIGSKAQLIKGNFWNMITPILITYGIFIFLFILGFIFAFLFKQRKPTQIITYIINTGFKNNSLSLVLADKYFSPKIALFLILSSLPWNTLLGPVKLFYAKYLKEKK